MQNNNLKSNEKTDLVQQGNSADSALGFCSNGMKRNCF